MFKKLTFAAVIFGISLPQAFALYFEKNGDDGNEVSLTNTQFLELRHQQYSNNLESLKQKIDGWYRFVTNQFFFFFRFINYILIDVHICLIYIYNIDTIENYGGEMFGLNHPSYIYHLFISIK